MQLHDLKAGLFELVSDVAKLVAHVAIVVDEGQHDVLDRTDALLLRQLLVGAVEPLGKALAVGQVRLKDLGDVAQDPVDLLVFRRRLPTRRRLTATLNRARLGSDRETAKRNADPTEEQKLNNRRPRPE